MIYKLTVATNNPQVFFEVVIYRAKPIILAVIA